MEAAKNGCQFANNILKITFFNENCWIVIHISLKYVLKDPSDYKWALVLIMAWRRTGGKPLPEKNDNLLGWRIYALLSLFE